MEVILFLFMVILCTLCLSNAQNCPNYSGQTQVIAYSYTTLSCAVQYFVPSIIVNTSFQFQGTINLESANYVHIHAQTPNIVLRTFGTSQMFNLSNNANVSLSYISLIGSIMSSKYIDFGSLIFLTNSQLNLRNVSLQGSSATVCGAGIYSKDSVIMMDNCVVSQNFVVDIDKCALQTCGAGLAAYGGYVTIRNSLFSNNLGTNGAVSLTGSVLSISDTKFEHNSGLSGGAICITGSSGTLSNIVANNNTVATFGGAFNFSHSSLTLDEIACVDNRAGLAGGCLCSANSTVSLTDSLLTQSFADNGGAVYLTSGGSLDVATTSIVSNRGSSGGGILVTNSSVLSLSKCNVTDNISDGIGGAIAILFSGRVNITESLIDNNIIAQQPRPVSFGGSFYVYNGALSVFDSTLSHGLASQGSIVFAFGSNISITSTVIEHNIADSSGIYAGASSRINVNNATFNNNTGRLSTSCLSCLSTLECVIANSLFHNNKAQDQGNVFIQLTTANITNSVFHHNTVGESGGAVFLSSESHTTMTGCQFISNKATVFGGALLVQMTSTLAMFSTYFEANIAASGGAVYAFNSVELTMLGITFTQNQAYGSGGSLFISTNTVARATNVTITRCISPFGGAIYVSYNSLITIDDMIASYNMADYSGGVIALYDGANATITDSQFFQNKGGLGGVTSGQYQTYMDISHSTFTGNAAHEYGGVGYLVVESQMNITYCTFTGNNADQNAGILQVQSSQVWVSGSTFTGNSASDGGCFYLEQATGYLTNNSFTANSASSTGGVTVIDSDSLLVTTKNTYVSNSAESGGVLLAYDSVIRSTLDTHTKCLSKTEGGCIFAIEDCDLTSVSDSFTKNTAQNSDASVLYMEGGTLYMSGTAVTHNTALQYGSITLYATKTTIVNSTFGYNIYSHNTLTASTSYSEGAALYFTSLIGQGSFNIKSSVYISSCTFYGNNAGNSYGGAIYINAYPGPVTITASTFTNNSAANGGAIASTTSNVSLVNNIFTNNKAIYGGGAIYWVYNTKYVMYIPSSNIHYRNNASYGDYKATNLVSLNATVLPSSTATSSGGSAPVMKVFLLDFYNQIVTNSSVMVYASTTDTVATIKGNTIVQCQLGVAVFSDMIVTANPSSNASLQFDVPIAGIEPTTAFIKFRACESGEVYTVVSSNQATCVQCGNGTFSFYPDEPCAECPLNARCWGGNKMDLDANYWRVNNVSSKVLQCPVEGVCLGGTNVETQCAEGQTGPYCDVCEPGYVQNSSGLCYSCNSKEDLVSEILSTIVFVILILIAALLVKFQKKIMKFYNEKMDQLNSNVKFRTLRVKGKIVLAFFQILFQLGPALNVIFPINFTSYLNYYAIFQINFLYLPDLNCVFDATFYDNLLFSTLFPFVAFIVLAAVFQLIVIRAARLNSRHPYYTKEKALQNTFTVAFLISYFVLISVSTTIFQVFQCETFDDGTSYLVADYKVSCTSEQYYFFRAYGTIMIFVYPVGIPLTYAIVLFRNRKYINPSWRLVIDGKEKVLVSKKVIQHEKVKVRNTYPQIKNISNLYDNYIPKRWYFELFDCARRLCLGAVPVLMFRGSVLQVIIVLLVSLASVGVFMYFKPYIHAMDNNLAIMAQWSITLVLISALIIKVDALDEDSDSRGMGVVLILLNVLVIGFGIASTLAGAKPVKRTEGERDVFGDDEDDLYSSDEGDDEDEDEDDEDVIAKAREISTDGGGTNGLEMSPLHKATKNHTEIKKKVTKKERKLQEQLAKNKKKSALNTEVDSDDDEDEVRRSAATQHNQANTTTPSHTEEYSRDESMAYQHKDDKRSQVELDSDDEEG